MPSLVTVPEEFINSNNQRRLRDLAEYFSPDLFLVPGAQSSESAAALELYTDIPAETLRLLDDLTTHTIEGTQFIFIPGRDALQSLRETTFDERLVLINNFLYQEYDELEFSHQLVNLGDYLDVLETVTAPAIRHLTIREDAGTHLESEDLDRPIHGIQWVEGKGDTPHRYIPRLRLANSGVAIEYLREDRLGLPAIPGLGTSYRETLRSHGVKTRDDIRLTDPEDLLRIPNIGAHRAASYYTSAHAFHDNTAYRFSEVPFEDQPRTFVDIETDGTDNPTALWQIGVYDEPSSEYTSFLQKNPEKPEEAISAFGNWLGTLPSQRVFLAWNGHDFDFKHLSAYFDQYGTDHHLDDWNSYKKADLKADVVDRCAALPCRSWSLDAITSRLGYQSTQDGLTGRDAAEFYHQYRADAIEPDWQTWINYCKDDVLQMVYLYHALLDAEQAVDKSELQTAVSELENAPEGWSPTHSIGGLGIGDNDDSPDDESSPESSDTTDTSKQTSLFDIGGDS